LSLTAVKPMSRKPRPRSYVEPTKSSEFSSEFSEPQNADKSGLQIDSKINQYLCLVPVFGLVPSVLALVSRRSDRKLKDVSKVAVFMAIAWLVSTGAGSADGASSQASLEILKGTISSTYFAACIWLMFRIYKDKTIALPLLDLLSKSKRRVD
jgi:hypothetical protein